MVLLAQVEDELFAGLQFNIDVVFEKDKWLSAMMNGIKVEEMRI